MNYYVFRIDYSSPILKDELKSGRLRQGWGKSGFDIEKGPESYVSAYRDAWGEDYEGQAANRFKILERMLHMEKGDLVIIPKCDISTDEERPRAFTMARVTGPYFFDVLDDVDDFGHVIPIELIATFNYDYDDNTRIINRSFSGYQSCVNHVVSNRVSSAIDELCSQAQTGDLNRFLKKKKSLEALDEATKPFREQYIESLVRTIRNWRGTEFEKVLESLFSRQGYVLIAKNQFDRRGGDIDLLFTCFQTDSMLSDILDDTEGISIPTLRIQAKCKEGVDKQDITGISQLKLSEGSENAINIFITTTEDISDEARREAEGSVVLISARQLAYLLMKYGFELNL